MAEIVLGIGTSHGPMLVTDTGQWANRVAFDKATVHRWRGQDWTFDALVAERAGEGLAAQITESAMVAHDQRCQAALDQLARIFTDMRIDIAVIIGNDQMEIFDERLIPALSIMSGERITNQPLTDARLARLPPGIVESLPGYIPAGGADYPGHPPLAEAIIRQAIREDFDIAAMHGLPRPETPHAFGFVYRRIMQDQPVPGVPLLVNTFYPPNQPRIRRCHDFGRMIRRAIDNWDSAARVAVFASGGLSHFVIDEQLDTLFLDALTARDIAPVAALGEGVFQDGTSEMKNWVVLAGVMDGLPLTPRVIDYVPCYRSLAGTGNAMGFVIWH